MDVCCRRGSAVSKGTGKGQLQIVMLNDLRNAYRKFEVDSKEAWLQKSENALVVLDVFELKDGEGRTYLGCYFTSRKIFGNVLAAHNAYGAIPYVTDGKKKMENCGWDVISGGTTSKRWDSNTHHHTVQFRPFGYTFTKAETIVAFASGELQTSAHQMFHTMCVCVTGQATTKRWAKIMWDIDIEFACGIGQTYLTLIEPHLSLVQPCVSLK